MVDVSTLVPQIVSGAINLGMLLLGGGLVAGLAYWLFVIKNQKKWLVEIWEEKNGRIYLVARDTLREIKYNKGKNSAYILKNAKKEIIPPPVECIQKYKGKEYVNYLRLLNDYIPLINEVVKPIDDGTKTLLQRKVTNILKALKKGENHKVLDKYIYAPLNTGIVGQLNYKPLDYDVSLMMTNNMDTMDKIYAEKQDFWAKYGVLMGIGMILVMALVVIYLSYEYGQFIMERTMAVTDNMLNQISNVADKIGGSPPPA